MRQTKWTTDMLKSLKTYMDDGLGCAAARDNLNLEFGTALTRDAVAAMAYYKGYKPN